MAEAILSDRELVIQFESLGDNCELGLVQRMAGAEPLGLLRFAGVPLRHLIRAMEARFEGMADTANIRVEPQNGEYMIRLTKYDFIYHAHAKIGEADPATLHRQHTSTVRFLTNKLIGDLEQPEKIMVFRQNEVLSANDLLDFRSAISAYGPATLLWVQEARPGHPPGSVLAVDDTLMVGYVTRLARRENAPDLDLRSWLTMLRKAHAARPGRSGELKRNARVELAVSLPCRIDVVFGNNGNARALTGDGWSGPEDGYTWSIDDRSLLTIPRPAVAGEYLLEIDVVPYIAPPRVTAQTLRVAVNGEWVHTFDPLPRGTVACIVPGRWLSGRDEIEILLEHPAAASPRAVAGENDDRRLAVSFYRLSLIGR